MCQSIVLASDQGDAGGLVEIVRIAADGSGRTNLTQTAAVDDFGPNWQPLAGISAKSSGSPPTEAEERT